MKFRCQRLAMARCCRATVLTADGPPLWRALTDDAAIIEAKLPAQTGSNCPARVLVPACNFTGNLELSAAG
jgi:hypothetical protein